MPDENPLVSWTIEIVFSGLLIKQTGTQVFHSHLPMMNPNKMSRLKDYNLFGKKLRK